MSIGRPCGRDSGEREDVIKPLRVGVGPRRRSRDVEIYNIMIYRLDKKEGYLQPLYQSCARPPP